MVHAHLLAALNALATIWQVEERMRQSEVAHQGDNQRARETAETRLSKPFGDLAWRERRAADIWRLIAVGAMLMPIALALALPGLTKTAGPVALLSKVSVSSLLLTLAGYAASQSSQHRKTSRGLSGRAIRLASLLPFLELEQLSPEARVRILENFSILVFAEPDGEGDATGKRDILDRRPRQTNGDGSKQPQRAGSTASTWPLADLQPLLEKVSHLLWPR
jgi:hypothetical protein